MKITFYIIPFLLLLMSCSKEKSDRWIILDVNSTIDNSIEPIDVELRLNYKWSSGMVLSGGGETINLGKTIYGQYYNEIKIPKKATFFELQYYSKEEEIPLANQQQGKGFKTLDIDLDKNKINKIEIKVKPVYEFYFDLKNVNCFDMSDSMWLNQYDYSTDNVSPEFTVIGCNEKLIGPLISFNSVVNYKYIVKRNGISSFYERSDTLKIGMKQIEVEY